MNARREHLPSPVKQHILWSSPLKGMEQPVRSFKSFIRSVPPYQSPKDHKPLPPTPSALESPSAPQGPTSPSSPELAPLERTSSVTSWRAPAEWEWRIASPSAQPYRSTSIFSARKYSPLLPEPSPGDPEMYADSNSWPFGSASIQQPQLFPIQESLSDKPEPPRRSPFRSSPHQTARVEGDAKVLISSTGYDNSGSSPYPEALRVPGRLPKSEALSYRVSGASTKAKAFASLGIGSPRITKAVRNDWTNNSGLAEDDAPAHLNLCGKKPRPLGREDLEVNDDLGNNELAEKLQQLSFSQDYHDVLADQYHKLHAQRPYVLAVDQERVSQPLAWKKRLNGMSLSGSSPNLQTSASSASEKKKRHGKMASWAPLHHLHNGHKRRNTRNDVHQRSASDSAVPQRKKIPESEVDQLLGQNIRLPHHLLAHARGFRFNKRRVRVGEVGRTIEARSQPTLLPSPPLEQPTPLLRLPGGFVLVRQSPSETPPLPQTTSSHDVSPLSEIPRRGSNTSSLASMSDTSHPRSSIYNQNWQVTVAPTVAVNKKQRNSMGSLGTVVSHSSTSSPPTSPLAQEISLPRTPPPIPPQPARAPKVPPFPSSLPSGSEKLVQGEAPETEDDHETHMHRILDRARGARDAWKNHQRELRHEKLKQSIKVLGPTDPAVVAGYVKREGRRPGNREGEAGRMPGYLMTGPI